MKRIENAVQIIGIALMVITIAIAASRLDPSPSPGPGPGPDPKPEPPPTVESPFPAQGFFLLLAAQANDKPPLTVVRSAEFIRTEPGLNSRWHDYDQAPESPWKEALQWAKQKSSGTAYYVARHGDKASEGKLTGTAAEMSAQLANVIGELR